MALSWKRLLIILLVASVVLGSIFGVLVRDVPNPKQIYSFSPQAIYTDGRPVSCPGIIGNYSDWFMVNVIGNRTGFSYQALTIYSPATNLQLVVPLNTTFYAHVDTINSSLQIIVVPLGFQLYDGQTLDGTLTYTISGSSPLTQSFVQVPLRLGNVTC